MVEPTEDAIGVGLSSWLSHRVPPPSQATPPPGIVRRDCTNVEKGEAYCAMSMGCLPDSP